MQGTVNKVNFNGKAYSAEIGGTWYGAGFDKPGFSEGDVVEFEVEQRGKFKNLRGAKVVGTSQGQSNAFNSSAPKGSQAVDPQVWIDKDVSILYQSCRKDAIAFVDLLLKNSAISVPTKKSEAADTIKALVEDYAAQFYVKTKDVVQAGGATLEDSLPSFE